MVVDLGIKRYVMFKLLSKADKEILKAVRKSHIIYTRMKLRLFERS